MTTQTWDGSTRNFETSAAWSLGSVPGRGDTAIINAGTVLETGTINGVTVKLGGTTGAKLQMTGGTLAAGTAVSLTSYYDSLIALGLVSNFGTITLSGSVAVSPNFIIAANGATAGTFRNYGTITLESSPTIYTTDANSKSVLQNDGQIVVSNPTASGLQQAIISVPITGTGTITLNNAARVAVAAPVGSGQTVVFTPGGTNDIFELDAPGTFNGTIKNFSTGDLLALIDLPTTTMSYTQTSATRGTLTLSSGGVVRSSIAMQGVYTLANFTKSYADFGQGGSNTNIATNATIPKVFYTDTVTSTNGSAFATLYDGPVSYLQWQYLWNSNDGVALSVSTPNVFLHGGAGNDALQVTSGQNVLDGGGGSNFLVGGTGPGSADTFYVDGTSGQSTWSTIVNFHAGDSATIFGFNPGVSTLPWTASDGAAGYTGATIHSELGGAGTGANGSITFAGIDLNTANAYFDITSGTIGTIGYLLLQYNATPHVSYTDIVTGTSSTAQATAYTGPVAGLQWQYLWSGSDGVAISAAMPNVFLHGGNGNDALAVTGGVNVLDGGGGSNFLVGGTGPGSADTFFVDGTSGQNTWSTIVNFHQGDSATIFGFNSGISTLPWTASDGAAGYTGATIHSELGGAGTGANGSITFAGLDLAAVQSHFTITSGTIGSTGYLLIQYDH